MNFLRKSQERHEIRMNCSTKFQKDLEYNYVMKVMLSSVSKSGNNVEKGWINWVELLAIPNLYDGLCGTPYIHGNPIKKMPMDLNPNIP